MNSITRLFDPMRERGRKGRASSTQGTEVAPLPNYGEDDPFDGSDDGEVGMSGATAMVCPACDYENKPSVPSCNLCGFMFVSPPPTADPDDPTRDPILAEINSELEAERKAWGDLVKRRCREHAIIGVIAFALASMAVNYRHLLESWTWVQAGLLGLFAGAPVGYAVSRFRGGAWLGGLLSSVAFIVAGYFLQGAFSVELAGVGLIPGILIGIHVSLD